MKIAHSVQMVKRTTIGAFPMGSGFGASLGSEKVHLYQFLHFWIIFGIPPGFTEGAMSKLCSAFVVRSGHRCCQAA